MQKIAPSGVVAWGRAEDAIAQSTIPHLLSHFNKTDLVSVVLFEFILVNECI
jgi:hypothetical protein